MQFAEKLKLHAEIEEQVLYPTAILFGAFRCLMAQHENTLLSGDSYFFNFLNSKVRLTELGLYILGSIKGVPTTFEQAVDYANQYDASMFTS